MLKLYNLHIALFFKEIENRPDKFISKLTEVSDSIFNQMPVILPIPVNAPPELHVVIMNSEDNIYRCAIAKSRIDFQFNCVNVEDDNIYPCLLSFINKIRPYVEIIFGNKTINRFGFISNYFFETINPVCVIQSKYLNDSLSVGELDELNIRYNKKFESNGLYMNDIVDLNAGFIVENEQTKYGISILRDINNMSEDNMVLPMEIIFSIIKSQFSKLQMNGIMEILR